MTVKKLFSALLRVRQDDVIDATLSIDDRTLTPIISGSFVEQDCSMPCMQGFSFDGREWIKFGYHG